MYLYVEQWNVTQNWMDLSKEERRAYFDKVSTGIQELINNGVENVGWAFNDEHTPNRSDYYYMAVWKMPSIDYVEQLEAAVADAGWYDYFSQVNSRGQVLPINEALKKLINLEESTTMHE